MNDSSGESFGSFHSPCSIECQGCDLVTLHVDLFPRSAHTIRSIKSMKSTTIIGILAGTLAGASAAFSQDGDTNSAIAQLRAEVAALRAQDGDKWLTNERANEIKSLVQDVLADSQTRTSLQSSGATSGYNNGFFISSADGNFRLQLNMLAQARFTWNNQSESDKPTNNPFANSTSDNAWGFENRRTAMAFSGNIVDPSWTYLARTNYGSDIDPYTPTSGDVVLQDAWINKDFGNGFSVKTGQFKSPFMAESMRNDGAQLTAERSVVDYNFSGGYVQGIMLNYSSEPVRVAGSYNNGPRGQNSTWTAGNNSISLAGRAEFKAMGSWAQFETESSAKSDESGLVIGAAIQYYNNRGSGNNPVYPAVSSEIYGFSTTDFDSGPGIDEVSVYTTGAIDWTVDATFKSGGLNLSAAFAGANYTHGVSLFNGVTTTDISIEQSSYGMVVQGGYRFTDALEGFGRWEWYNIPDGSSTPGSGHVAGATNVNTILTFGANVYAGTNMKWTTQFGISLSETGNGVPNLNGAGYQADIDTAADDQFNVITQLQIMF